MQVEPNQTHRESFKVDGDKLTGTVEGPLGKLPISNGKISGDTIKGKIDSERNGKSRSTDWEAKRQK